MFIEFKYLGKTNCMVIYYIIMLTMNILFELSLNGFIIFHSNCK